MRGFSLVELSIVLVILGLLTGGILAGQSLIRASELRAAVTEFQRYSTAVYTFRDKYFALPGDMTNATKFWGAQDAGDGLGVDCTAVVSTTTATCNGNGDGLIGATGSMNYETLRAWHHLANAGLIEGNYTGVAGAGGTAHVIIGTNAPRSRISNAGWGINHLGTQDGTSSPFAGEYGNTFYFGGQHNSNPPYSSVIKAEEAWNIDTKVDEGNPGRGKLRTPKSTFRPDCATTDDPATAVYDLIKTTTACHFLFSAFL